MNFMPPINKYVSLVMKLIEVHPSWRIGQTYFNALCDIRPDIAEQVRGSNLDPFHRNERVPDFMEYVMENWDNPPQPVQDWYNDNKDNPYAWFNSEDI